MLYPFSDVDAPIFIAFANSVPGRCSARPQKGCPAECRSAAVAEGQLLRRRLMVGLGFSAGGHLVKVAIVVIGE